jgi:3,4-dihydroxy 2-butanone 4-phosphate synthase/GTP cyclohydrolase II
MRLNPAQKEISPIASVDEIIAEARAKRMFILTDDEDRENEGDLVFPAEFVTPEVINFMAHFGCGLICLALAPELVERLKLPMMTQNNRSRFETAFTISIEAREGVTTGISAYDRAHTIRTAIDPGKGEYDIVSPGHVFPLKANPNGVLGRRGQTEGSVDIMRLAGLTPAAVICEVMKEDGTMARLMDLADFAHRHDMKIGTISDLASYRQGLKVSDKHAIR